MAEPIRIEAGKVVRTFGAYCDRVLAGETFILTRFGRDIAVLGPAKPIDQAWPLSKPVVPIKQNRVDAVADPAKPGKATVQTYSQRQGAQAARDKILGGVKTK
jgi:antitoxin (DNA-binding transcriptional repressor) of toxin-antitoxin stability system